MGIMKKYKRAFTLTEVLIAIAIVGVLAAIIIPMIVTSYQSRVFEGINDREKIALQTAVSSLVVTENKAKFSDTMMYVPADPDDYTNSSGKFMKKYLRISRDCGSVKNGSSDCFASQYYEYSENDKKKFTPNLSGYCSQLKNGISICLKPQVGGNPAEVIMDLNGPKGPNILGRDLRVVQQLESITNRTASKATDNAIFAENQPPVTPDDSIGYCASQNDRSDDCCEYRDKNNQITDPSKPCCQNPNYKNHTKCTTKVTIDVNYYPTSFTSGAKAYLSSGGTSNQITPKGTKLPSGLPGIRVKCQDGTLGPTMSLSTLQSSLEKTSGKTYFSGTLPNATCIYPKEDIIWNISGGTNITTLGGVEYKIIKH